MKFRLIHKKLGVKSFKIFSEFEYPDIRDVCFVKDVGFLCLGENSLIEVTESGFKEVLTIDNPLSICLGSINCFYVMYNGGIKRINYTKGYYSTDVMGLKECEDIFKYRSKIGLNNICIHKFEDIIGIAVPDINKFYKVRKSSIEKEFGNFIAEYSVANHLEYSSLSHPRGIFVYDVDTIFVSDTGNGCIRSFGEEHRIIVGNPASPQISPTKILLDREREILYYLSKNYLRSVKVDGSKDILLYEGENVKSMALTDDGKIYVLEALEGEL